MVSPRKFDTILVTGGAGFIGSNFIRFLFGKSGFAGRVINLDALTYAGNLENLSEVDRSFGGRRYFFEHGDICDPATVLGVFDRYRPDAVAHFAGESHVDRSIVRPERFVATNIVGTFNLLDTARRAWSGRRGIFFHHVSTDEVYGSLESPGKFTEDSDYDPRTPYAASKAGADHLVMAYHHTYGLPVGMTHCTNNYGPYQFPEKLIPLMILNMIEGKSLPVYGDGRNIRDWIYVEDHNRAVWDVMLRGEAGRSYNIGGENEWENIKLVSRLIDLVAAETGKDPASLRNLITPVRDRPGHDRRYAIDCSRIKEELGWRREESFDDGLRKTVHWYLEHGAWCERVRSGEYKNWLAANYQSR